MKKTSIILSVLAMAALLVTGCGKDSKEATTMRFLRADGEAWITDDEQKNLDVTEGLSLYSGYGVGTSAHANAWLTLDEATLAKMDYSSEIGIEKSDDGNHLEVDVKSGTSLDETETEKDSPDSALPYDPKAGLELPEIPDDGIEREVIEVADNDAFQALFSGGRDLSNTEIRIGDGEYAFDYGLSIGTCDNLSIIGTGKTQIVVNNGGATVLDSYGAKNLLLYGLVLGHDIPPMDECSMGVLSFFGCENVSVIGCDIYGCGLVGIEASGDVTVTDSVIRECSYSAVQTYSDCTVHFVNSIIQDNNEPYLFVGAEGTKFIFDNCTIQGNHSTAEFAPTSDGMEPDVTMNNTTEKDNAWQ